MPVRSSISAGSSVGVGDVWNRLESAGPILAGRHAFFVSGFGTALAGFFVETIADAFFVGALLMLSALLVTSRALGNAGGKERGGNEDERGKQRLSQHSGYLSFGLLRQNRLSGIDALDDRRFQGRAREHRLRQGESPHEDPPPLRPRPVYHIGTGMQTDYCRWIAR